MVSARITIDDEAVRRALAGLRTAGADLYPAMDEIGSAMVASTQQRFETGRRPDGNPWPPSIRALAQGGQTLVDKARLVQSLTHEAGDSSVEWGTNLVYAAIHQFFGTIRAKGGGTLRFRIGDRWVSKREVTIPARPFLGIDDDDEREIGAILADHLRDAAPGALEGQP